MIGQLRRNNGDRSTILPTWLVGRYDTCVCLLLLATLSFDTCLCGDDGNTDDSDNGDDVQERNSVEEAFHPYAILLREGTKYFCSGAIVHVSWVISAAQCSHGAKTTHAFAGIKSYRHMVATRFPFEGLQVRKISVIRIHHLYNRKRKTNDIMMGRTDHPWQFDDVVHAIHIVGLEGYDLKNISDPKAIGFKRASDTSYAINMFEASVSVSNVTECKGTWNKMQERSVVCTTNPGISICPYNAGGSLVSGDSTLLGLITTFWKKCRSKKSDVVFTYLPYYARWMKTVMVPHKDCSGAVTSRATSSFVLVLGTYYLITSK